MAVVVVVIICRLWLDCLLLLFLGRVVSDVVIGMVWVLLYGRLRSLLWRPGLPRCIWFIGWRARLLSQALLLVTMTVLFGAVFLSRALLLLLGRLLFLGSFRLCLFLITACRL